MTVRYLPKMRRAFLAVVILVTALCLRWLTAQPPLTPAEQALVGTWVEESAEDPAVTTIRTSHLTFGPDHSATKSDFVFGPDAPPQVYHFTWRVEEDGLVVQHVIDSLFDRLSGRVSTPEYFGLVSVTETAMILRRSDGSQVIQRRLTRSGQLAHTTK
jgi:hypothetical protein